MRAEVARDLVRSAGAFEELVWPEVRGGLRGGELISVEDTHAAGVQAALDLQAGIDAWQVVPGGGMRGIASRVQPVDRAWDTFTIRYSRRTGAETEFDKRLRAIEEVDAGWMLPHITIQAYVNLRGTELLSAGVVRTRDLILYVRDAIQNDLPNRIQMRTTRSDGNTFVVVPWGNLTRDGIAVKRFPKGMPRFRPLEAS